MPYNVNAIESNTSSIIDSNLDYITKDNSSIDNSYNTSKEIIGAFLY